MSTKATVYTIVYPSCDQWNWNVIENIQSLIHGYTCTQPDVPLIVLTDETKSQYQYWQSKLSETVKVMHPSAKRGDIINLQVAGQQEPEYNAGKFVWDGSQLIALQVTYDDCGAIPTTFQVTQTEFSPVYWREAIEHNMITFLSQELRSEAVTNLHYRPTPNDIRNIVGADTELITTLTIQDVLYTIHCYTSPCSVEEFTNTLLDTNSPFTFDVDFEREGENNLMVGACVKVVIAP